MSMLSSQLAAACPAVLHAYWALATSAALLAALPMHSMQGFRCGFYSLASCNTCSAVAVFHGQICMHTCLQACCAAVGGPWQAVGQQAARQSGTSDGEHAMQSGTIYKLALAIVIYSMCILCRMPQSHSAGLATSMHSALHAMQHAPPATLRF